MVVNSSLAVQLDNDILQTTTEKSYDIQNGQMQEKIQDVCLVNSHGKTYTFIFEAGDRPVTDFLKVVVQQGDK